MFSLAALGVAGYLCLAPLTMPLSTPPALAAEEATEVVALTPGGGAAADNATAAAAPMPVPTEPPAVPSGPPAVPKSPDASTAEVYPATLDSGSSVASGVGSGGGIAESLRDAGESLLETLTGETDNEDVPAAVRGDLQTVDSKAAEQPTSKCLGRQDTRGSRTWLQQG